MSLGLPEAKPDTMEEIFSDKCQRINLDHYSIYHFEDMVIDGRKYQYRLSSKGDVMTVVGTFAGQAILMVSVWTNMEHENRIREIHQYILEREAAGVNTSPSQDGSTAPPFKGFVFNRAY
uniref:Transcriptional regulator n=1 Tax=Mesocestoides corti TaxID=53468 RepID=A0A5K3F5B8_MESCO